MIDFIDLFSGIGGFRLGLKRANNYMETEQSRRKGRNKNKERISTDSSIGSMDSNDPFRCVWSNDFNKYANEIYTKHFGKENHSSADIKGVNPKEIPDFDLLCAGFPCQSFSTAGKRKGFQDTRGTLFFEICRIAEAKRPTLLLLENVKGLLNHDRGRTFTIILQSLEELGYWIEWQVFNSKYFGVPQTRDRVFIVGHLRGGSTRAIFPITEGNGVSTKELEKIGNIAQTGHDSIWGRVYDPDGIAMNLNDEGGGLGAKTGLYAVPVLTPDRKEKRQHGRRFKEPGEPAFTLTGQDKHGVLVPDIANTVDADRYLRFDQIIDGQALPIGHRRIRRLTPLECERLQGFPDGWTEGLSDTQRGRVLGNAVTVNVVEFLGELIKSQFKKNAHSEDRVDG